MNTIITILSIDMFLLFGAAVLTSIAINITLKDYKIQQAKKNNKN